MSLVSPLRGLLVHRDDARAAEAEVVLQRDLRVLHLTFAGGASKLPHQLSALAVSYTHLDVYKRQVPADLNGAREVNSTRPSEAELNCADESIRCEVNESNSAVSYTHLDVYKRQLWQTVQWSARSFISAK